MAGGRGPLLTFSLPSSASSLVCTLRGRCGSAVRSRMLSYPSYDLQKPKLELDMSDDAKGLVTKYYCNRNPRSPELLGIAEKPRGFATWHRRMDYYHRYDCNDPLPTFAPLLS